MDALQKKRQEAGLDPLEDEIVNGKKEAEETEDVEDEEPDETEEEDGQEEDEEDEDEEDPSPKEPLTKQFNKLRKDLRDMRRENEELKKNHKPAEEVDEDFITSKAKEMLPDDASAEEIESTKFQLKKILELTGNNKQNDEITKLQEKLAEFEDEKSFNSDWEEFSDDLREKYPKANGQQLRAAKKAMDELSHAPQFADKEFDYIVYKNQQIFDEIFVNRRTKTFESRDNYSHKEDNGEEEQDENPTNNALKLRDKMRKEAKKKDDESGWKIHNPNS